MAEQPVRDINVDEIWVNTSEAAELTGYNYHSIRKVIQRIASQPEDSREIKMRRRTTGWEMWLPDLMAYVERPRSGPPIKRKKE